MSPLDCKANFIGLVISEYTPNPSHANKDPYIKNPSTVYRLKYDAGDRIQYWFECAKPKELFSLLFHNHDIAGSWHWRGGVIENA
jgi:hypothetical protein